MNEPIKIPIEKVLDDMDNPDGGMVSIAARDYYELHYSEAPVNSNKLYSKNYTRNLLKYMVYFIVYFKLILFLQNI